MASGPAPNVALKRTRRNSSFCGVSALHTDADGNDTGSAASRSVSAAISACFATRRSSCQTPRPMKAAIMTR